MKKVYFILISLFLSLSVSAQNVALAKQYFSKGEYEKAEALYKKIYEKNKNSYYLKTYISTLIQLQKFEEATKVANNHIKLKPKDFDAYILKGTILEDQGKSKEAEKIYDEVITKMPNNKVSIIRIASTFTQILRKDYAIKSYEKGKELLNDEKLFAYELARLYNITEEPEKVINSYLLALEENPNRLQTIKLFLQRDLDKKHYPLLQELIYNKISEGNDNPLLADLLSWVALQSEDYFSAFLQLRAIDERTGGTGEEVYNLGKIAQNGKDFETALDAYDYVIEKGRESPYFLSSYMGKLNLIKNIAVNKNPIQEKDLMSIDSSYDAFVENIGINSASASVLLNQANFNLKYLNNPRKAKTLLQKVIDIPSGNGYLNAKAKLKLADYYLLEGNRWEATLLYSQVDKSFPEHDLGEQARFKNAMLSYYMGDFVWAKQQFDILKAATSRIISNDAIDMSIFIADNLNLDTTAVPMEKYAGVELLLFQNQYDSALKELDNLILTYPEHKLNDDILYLKGKIYEQRGNYEKAIEMYESVMNDYPDEIRADNAIYQIAQLYEFKLENLELAKQMYEKLFIEYDNSTFSIEARKRYRKLNGEIIQ